MSVKLTFTADIKNFHKFYEKLGKSIYKETQRANERAAHKTVVKLKEATVKAGSIGASAILDRKPSYYQGWRVEVLGRNVVILNDAPWAKYVLGGTTGPYKALPPLEKIKEWVEVKLGVYSAMAWIVADRIRKKIAEKGTRPRNILLELNDWILKNHRQEIERSLKLAAQVAAGK